MALRRELYTFGLILVVTFALILYHSVVLSVILSFRRREPLPQKYVYRTVKPQPDDLESKQMRRVRTVGLSVETDISMNPLPKSEGRTPHPDGQTDPTEMRYGRPTVPGKTLRVLSPSPENWSRAAHSEGMESTGKRYGKTVPGQTHIIFNPLPKTGSRTLNTIAHSVAKRRGIVVENTMSLSSETIQHKLERLLNDPRPTFIYTHVPYYTAPVSVPSEPVYISIVRDPIERLVSLYYFKVFGDSTEPSSFRTEMDQRNFTKDSFDVCFRKRGECVAGDVHLKTVRQFCGVEPGHLFPPARVCLERSISTIKNRYLLVGVTEDYRGFLSVLERLLPDMFEGAAEIYGNLRRGQHFKHTKTKNKTGLSGWVRRKLREELKLEYEIYDYIKRNFEALKSDMGLS